MEELKLKLEPTVRLGSLKLVPLVRVSLFSVEFDGLLAFSGAKEVAYVAVADGQSTRIFSVSGDEVSLKQVRAECRNYLIDLEPEPDFQVLNELT